MLEIGGGIFLGLAAFVLWSEWRVRRIERKIEREERRLERALREENRIAAIAERPIKRENVPLMGGRGAAVIITGWVLLVVTALIAIS